MLAMIYVYIVDLYLVYKHEAAAILPTAVKITISPKCQISNLKKCHHSFVHKKPQKVWAGK